MACRIEPCRIAADDAVLEGDLCRPAGAAGLVVFAHGSGSSRFSVRNRQVAGYLADRGLATLLFDLLTPQEGEIDQHTWALRFDIPLISRRLIGAVDWVGASDATRGFEVGLFGASTGAAAALVAAAERPGIVRAVVSRGGRPDLAAEALSRVTAPTLLLVGGRDDQVLELNRWAQARFVGESELIVVPGATHLFEEPGALEQVQAQAARWMHRHLVAGA